MNAQVSKRPVAAREIAVPRGALPCPAEQIGRAIETAFREKCELEGSLPDTETLWRARLITQLEDRISALDVELQWVKATSLRGVYAQQCALRRIAEVGVDDPKAERAMARLFALVDRSIRELAGIREFELGGLSEVMSADDFADVLIRHTGQDVRES